MLKRSFLIGSMLAMGLVLSVFSNILAYALAPTPSPSPSNSAITFIVMRNLQFNSSNMTILSPNPTTRQNVTVSWYNDDYPNNHTVTSGTPGMHDSLPIDQLVTPGTFFNLTITPSLYADILGNYSNGELPYFCRNHFYYGMSGTLTISPTQIPEFPGFTFVLTIVFVSCAVLVFVRRRRLQ